MKTTLIQKVCLGIILAVLSILNLFEKSWSWIAYFFASSLRVFALFIVLGILASFSTKLVVLPGEMFESFFYYPEYKSAGLEIRKQLPKQVADVPAPYLTAESAIAVDVATGRVLFELNPDAPYPPASTTKVMTFLAANDIYNTKDKIVISPYCTTLDSTKAGFFSNEAVSVLDLYYALLINSAGDAACALSVAAPDFVERMNSKAQVLGLRNTTFSNAIGFDNYEGQLSTARDLSILGIAAMKNPLAREIVKTKTFTASSSGVSHILTNTNKLLWEIPESTGLKTGTTDAAGEVLIYFYDSGDKNIAVVVMKSSDRFGDTKKILNWVLNSYSWHM
jgi:D-alanyl-D-alanine carboxypeptidase